MVGGYEPDEMMFDAVAAFGRTSWLDGSQQEHNHWCNGTLIAPNLVVSAKHCGPSNLSPDPAQQPASGTYTFRFRRNIDGSIGTKAQGWESFHQVKVDHFILSEAAGDIYVAVLQEPVTHIKPIPLAIADDFDRNINIHVAGWGKEGPAFNAGTRGRLLVADTALSTISPTWVSFPSAWSSSNPCECGPNMFDSGGAVLVRGKKTVEGTFEAPDNKYLGASSSMSGMARVREMDSMLPSEHEEDFLQIIGVITTTGGGTRVDAHTSIFELIESAGVM